MCVCVGGSKSPFGFFFLMFEFKLIYYPSYICLFLVMWVSECRKHTIQERT